MPKPVHWFDRVCASGRLAGHCRGMVTLIEHDGGLWALYLYDQAIATGPREAMRNRYADYLASDPGGEWLARYYRS